MTDRIWVNEEDDVVASYTTAKAIYAVLVAHCTKEQIGNILLDLQELRGNSSFRDTVQRLWTIHCERKD